MSQQIGWKDYSCDIFRDEGFPVQIPDWRVIYCNGFIDCNVPSMYHFLAFLLVSSFQTAMYLLKACSCWKCY